MTDISARPHSMYRSRDPRELPAYGLREAARYVRMPEPTLRSWFFGRSYPTQRGEETFSPLIEPASRDPRFLSFNNLVEAHMLRALRSDHGVAIQRVRNALEYASSTLDIERLLLDEDLLAGPDSVFLERYGDLINLSRSGQLAMKEILRAYLHRLDRDALRLPIRFFPFLFGGTPDDTSRKIVIDPSVSFGRPTLVGKRIATEAIRQRIDAGESTGEVAADYEVSEEDITTALIFETAA